MAVSQNRGTVRAPAREPARETDLKPGEFRGRNGKILKFRPSNGNQYDIPEELKEPGWTYQWQAYTVYGQADVNLSTLLGHGWEFVPVDSPLGQYFCVPGEDANCIIRGGLVLTERPEAMTKMYKDETDSITRMQYESMMSKSSDIELPSGFKNGGKTVEVERASLRQKDLAKMGLSTGKNGDLEGIPDED
jgi:hypothetical protein